MPRWGGSRTGETTGCHAAIGAPYFRRPAPRDRTGASARAGRPLARRGDALDAHLIIGIGEYLLAYALSRVYTVLRFRLIGSCLIKLCGTAFRHGAGLDDAALMLLDEMGPTARLLLESEAERPGSEAAFLLRIMQRRREK